MELNLRRAAEVENNWSREKMGPDRGLAVVTAGTGIFLHSKLVFYGNTD